MFAEDPGHGHARAAGRGCARRMTPPSGAQVWDGSPRWGIAAAAHVAEAERQPSEPKEPVMSSSYLHIALHEARNSELRRAAERHRVAATRDRRGRRSRVAARRQDQPDTASPTVKPWPRLR